MSSDKSTLNLQDGMFERLIRDRLNSEITEALGGKEAFAERIIGAFLKMEVNENGYEAQSYETGMPLIEYVCRAILKKELTSVIMEWFAENAELFRKEIRKQLSNSEVQADVANALVGTLSEQAANAYGTMFKFEFVVDKKTD